MNGRRERKKLQTRAALMDAAMTLFADRGVYGTRIEDITEHVDLGKGAFYNYFPSKDALIAALVAQGVETLAQRYLTRLNGCEEELTVRSRHLAQLLKLFLEEQPQYAVLFHQARGLLMLRNSRVENLREVFAGYLRLLGRALVPKSDENGWSDDALIDVAAVVAGGVAGYRSFRMASGLPCGEGAEEVLSAGIPILFQRPTR